MVKLESSISLQNVSEYVKNRYFLIEKNVMYIETFLDVHIYVIRDSF